MPDVLIRALAKAALASGDPDGWIKAMRSNIESDSDVEGREAAHEVVDAVERLIVGLRG